MPTSRPARDLGARQLNRIAGGLVLALMPMTFLAAGPQSASAAGVVGYGTYGVDDYPEKYAPACGSGWCLPSGATWSSRGFGVRQCTDFTAWRKSLVWSSLKYDNGDGNARGWKQGALNSGYAAGTTPQVGAIAWWGREKGGGYGHVAVVTKVNPDGTAQIEEYNGLVPGGYSKRTAVVATAYLYVKVATPAQRPLADGTYLRVSETGALYVIRNGVPVSTTSTAAYGSGNTVASINQVRLTEILNGGAATYYPPVGATAPAPVVTPPATTTPTTARYQALSPARLLDTRATGGPIAAGSTRAVRVTGVGGVPTSGVDSVVLNVTSVDADRAGYLTAFPAGASRPGASSLNYVPGRALANQVVAKVGTNGTVNVFSSGRSGVVVDVVGWVPTSGTIRSVTPSRLHDTRVTKVRVPAGGYVDVPVLGRGGVPASGVAGVTLTTTAVAPSTDGWLTAYAADAARPATSNTNFAAGQTLAGSVFTRVGSSGKVRIYSSAATDLAVDVTGWIPTGSDYVATAPARTLDTRTGVGVAAGRVPANGTIRVPVLGRAGVPASGVKAVAVTVASVSPKGAGWVRAFPGGTAVPNASMLNHADGETIRNATIVKVGADGTIALNASAGTDLVADVQGYVVS